MNPLFQELNGPNSMMGQFGQFMQNPFAFIGQKRNINIPSQFGSNPQEAVNYLAYQFMQDPLAFVMQKRNINIPSQFGSDPHEAVNYLVSSGKMDQNTFNNLMAQATNMGCKF